MRRIIVFGATGGTGREIVKQALNQGYLVTAVIRNPSALNVAHEHLRIVKGEVLNPATFEKEIQKNDVVISCLGVNSGKKPTKVYSLGLQNVMSVMNLAAANRLICISAGALYTNKGMGLFIRLLTKVVLQKVFAGMYADMRLMETYVQRSNLDWTIVRPPMLKNKTLTGKYRTAVNASLKNPWSIARADLAHFMLSMVDDQKTFKAITEISY